MPVATNLGEIQLLPTPGIGRIPGWSEKKGVAMPQVTVQYGVQTYDFEFEAVGFESNPTVRQVVETAFSANPQLGVASIQVGC